MIDEQLIVSTYVGGASVSDIGKMYGYSYYIITKVLNQHSIKRRSISEQVARYQINRGFFSTLTNNSAYWFGYLLADGSIRSHKRKNGHYDKWLRVRISEKDRKHLELFQMHLGSNHPIVYESNTKSVRLQINSSGLTADLIKHGFHDFKKGEWIINPSVDTIRGLIDGDGWVSLSKRGQLTLGYCSPHRAQVEGMRDFLKVDVSVRWQKGVWRIDKNVTNDRSIYTLLCNGGPRLDRKWGVYDTITASNLNKLRQLLG